jgi:Mrp family chromosome partitioning ATPase
MYSVLSTGTQYTARAALTLGSPERAPEEDSVLAMGYVDYFNQATTQRRLRAAADLPIGVTFAARPAASSPIIYIEGVGADADMVRSSVSAMADAFRNDVNSGLVADKQARIAALQAEMTTQQEIVDGSPPTQDQRGSLAAGAVAELQTLINELRADTSNELQLLQSVSDVSGSRPSLAINIGLALIGGLILGALAALAFAAVRNRLGAAAEVADKLGVEVLADLGGEHARALSDEGRRRLKRLANLVGPGQVERPMVCGVVAPRRTAAARTVATAVAGYRAVQDERTVLVYLDPHDQPADTVELWGVADLLAPNSNLRLGSLLQPGAVAGLRVLPAGVAAGDSYERLTMEAVERLFVQLTEVASSVLVVVPPLLDTAEAQAICAAVKHVIMVVESDVTAVTDAHAALELLAQVKRDPMGCVVMSRTVAPPSRVLGETVTGAMQFDAAQPGVPEPRTVQATARQP